MYMKDGPYRYYCCPMTRVTKQRNKGDSDTERAKPESMGIFCICAFSCPISLSSYATHRIHISDTEYILVKESTHVHQQA